MVGDKGRVCHEPSGRAQASQQKGAASIVRPPLDEFLAHVNKEIVNAATLVGARPGAPGQEWLTQTVGGLSPFLDATLDFFPGRVWGDVLSWEPDAHDPLVWMRDGRRVAWFERVRGPVRHIHGGDFVYRQPTVARWVCVADEWQRMTDIVGLPRRRVRYERALVREL
jgi:hypothetical protein